MSTRESIITELDRVPDERLAEVAKLISHYTKQSSKSTDAQAQRPYGLCAGQFVVPDDFDAPLPDEILAEFDA